MDDVVREHITPDSLSVQSKDADEWYSPLLDPAPGRCVELPPPAENLSAIA
jgi:hypothetical protein